MNNMAAIATRRVVRHLSDGPDRGFDMPLGPDRHLGVWDGRIGETFRAAGSLSGGSLSGEAETEPPDKPEGPQHRRRPPTDDAPTLAELGINSNSPQHRRGWP
jgi:hypothetical protein